MFRLFGILRSCCTFLGEPNRLENQILEAEAFWDIYGDPYNFFICVKSLVFTTALSESILLFHIHLLWDAIK